MNSEGVPMKRLATALICVTLSACSHAPKGDADAVKAVLIGYVEALGDGDITMVRRLAVIDAAHEQPIQTQCEYGREWLKLDDAAVAKFGPTGKKVSDRDATREQARKAIESADVRIQGDSAAVSSNDLGAQPARLTRTAGQWKVDVARMPGADDPNAPARYEELAKSARQMIDEINAGQYATADAAAKAWRQRYVKALWEHPSPELKRQIEQQRRREQAK